MIEYRFICDSQGCIVQKKVFIFWVPITKNQTTNGAQTLVKNLRMIAANKIEEGS